MYVFKDDDDSDEHNAFTMEETNTNFVNPVYETMFQVIAELEFNTNIIKINTPPTNFTGFPISDNS